MSLFDLERYRGKRVCVALSGGVDSVSLLHCFKEGAEAFGIALSALHVEHGIRGEESVRDMLFCETLCGEWRIPLVVRRVNVPALAKERGESAESVARALRYKEFSALLGRGEADFIATAHHADDVAETVLFRLARGTGLSGMKAITEYGGIVRPLLGCTRVEIEAYAEAKALPHVEDSTNADQSYTRNYIRNTVLPAFGKIHGNAAKHLVEFAALAAEEDDFLQSLAESEIVRTPSEEKVPVDLPDVLFARACLICMRKWVPEGYTRTNIGEIKNLRQLQSGKKAALPFPDTDGALYAVREGGYIVFARERGETAEAGEYPFTPAAGTYSYPSAFSVEEGGMLRERGGLFVDLDAFPQGCVVRARREGDLFSPYHAPRKTLKKFLTDRKIPSRLSRNLPVIAKGKEVYAVVGVEIADAVKVTDETVRIGVLTEGVRVQEKMPQG